MNREIHVRFWEGLGVRFPRATHFARIQYWYPVSSEMVSNMLFAKRVDTEPG